MSKIKIEKDKFSSFIKFISLSNEKENKEALLDVTETGIKCLAVSEDKSLGLRATLKHPFIKLGQVGVDQIPALKKVTSALENEIEVEFTSNKLVVKNGRTTAWFPLKNVEAIENKLDQTKFESRMKETEEGISFNLSKALCDKLVKSYNLVGGSAVVLKFKDGILALGVKNETNEVALQTEIDVDKSKKNFNIKIGKALIDLLELIGDNVTLSLSEDSPTALAIDYSGKDFQYTYLLALVDNKAEAPKETKREKVNA